MENIETIRQTMSAPVPSISFKMFLQSLKSQRSEHFPHNILGMTASNWAFFPDK